jgi:carboxylesterase
MEPFDPAAVAAWTLGDGRRGALFIHGFAGTPPEMRRLGEHMAARGWRCSGPVLPGHGLRPEDLHGTRWRDWAAGVQRAFDELAEQCDSVVVAGQSMGGALALHLAATDMRVRAVACMATPLWLPGFAVNLLPVISRVVRWHAPSGEIDLWDQTAVDELHSYGLRSTSSILELKRLVGTVRDELVQIRAPALVLHGARDRLISPACAAEIARRLVSSPAVQLHVYPRSGHAVSIDVDREDVNRRVTAWFERFLPLPLSPSLRTLDQARA